MNWWLKAQAARSAAACSQCALPMRFWSCLRFVAAACVPQTWGLTSLIACMSSSACCVCHAKCRPEHIVVDGCIVLILVPHRTAEVIDAIIWLVYKGKICCRQRAPLLLGPLSLRCSLVICRACLPRRAPLSFQSLNCNSFKSCSMSTNKFAQSKCSVAWMWR